MNTTRTQNSQTRDALLACATALFTAQGYDGVSVRRITEACGANVAAVNYHFGGKLNLYREVLALALDRIAGEKVRLLQELGERQPAPAVAEIVRAYVRSHFDARLDSPEADRLMQIIYREMGPDAVAGDLVLDRLVTPIHRAFMATLLRSAPELDAGHAARCISSIAGQVLHFVRARTVLRDLFDTTENRTYNDDAVEHITQFSLLGIGSPHHV